MLDKQSKRLANAIGTNLDAGKLPVRPLSKKLSSFKVRSANGEMPSIPVGTSVTQQTSLSRKLVS